MSSRIAQTFIGLNGSAFIPFFTAGDPDIDTTAALVQEAGRCGADLIEIGIPFSDPIADGPVIQASYFRALEKGFKVAQAFELVVQLRTAGFEKPMVSMVSATLVYKYGVAAFFARAKECGYDGLIIPDLPVGYEGDAVEQARKHGLDLIFLCAPTTTPERRELIAKRSTGFLYYISIAGITGVRAALPQDLEENVLDLQRRTKTPVCVGFGISTPAQASAVAKIAKGAIIGSALVRCVAELTQQGVRREVLVKEIGAQVNALAHAVHGARG